MSILPFIQKVNETDSKITFIGFFEGLITSNNSIKSYIDRNKELIVNNLYLEPLYYFNRIPILSKYIKNITQESIFSEQKIANNIKIQDLEYPNNSIIINNFKNIKNYKKEFKLIAFKFINKNIIISDKIISYVIALFQILNIFFKHKLIKGIQIGNKIVELGIENSSKYVIFGKITYDKITKNMQITHPITILKNKLDLKYKLIKNLSKIEKMKSLFFIVFIIFSILFLKKLIRLKNNIITYIKESNKIRFLDKLRNLNKLFITDFNCILCKNNTKNIIYRPCYHYMICQECVNTKKNNNCEKCNKEVIENIKIFVD